MGRVKNPCLKVRPVNNPYEVWTSHDGHWEWRVLKKYRAPIHEEQDPFARWFCAVKSPYTFGSWEYGDVYAAEVKDAATKST